MNIRSWWYDYKEIVLTIGIVVIVILACVGPVIGWGVMFNYQECQRLIELDDTHEYDFRFWGGCFVQTPNGYWTSVRNSTLVDIPGGG